MIAGHVFQSPRSYQPPKLPPNLIVSMLLQVINQLSFLFLPFSIFGQSVDRSAGQQSWKFQSPQISKPKSVLILEETNYQK